MEKAVVDRIEGERAVLLVGTSERELYLPVRALPADTAEGDWLRITLSGECVEQVESDADETGRMRGRIQEKLARLQRRKRLPRQ